MKELVLFCAAVASTAAFAESVGFDNDAPGAIPKGWKCGVTGRGAAKWAVERDATAPSAPNVLKQSGEGTFPWCAKEGIGVADGYVEVKFKPSQGKEDRAGGVIWRFKDADNYYVARANAMENNVSLYYTTRGVRHTLKYVDAPVQSNAWHTLRADFTGKEIKVSLDGKQYIDLTDEHILGPGWVGVWTKADSVTAFDDFSWGANRKP
jgi:hypothetical protein